MNPGDLRALRTPLLALLAVVVAAASAIYYTDSRMRLAQQELMQQQAQLRDARTRLQRSGDEREIIVRHLDDYQRLVQSGFVGEEQRINWLDGLRLANQQTELFGVDYQISVQKPYVHAAALNPGQLTVMQSEMKLRFRLLHEEDLMRFFSSLAQHNSGTFLLDQCMMRRADTGGVIRYQPNLSAECDLSWITVRVPGRKP